MKFRDILSFSLILSLSFFAFHMHFDSLQLENKNQFFSSTSNCIDAPNVATIEFQQSTVTLPSHETLLIQATLKDSSGAIIGTDPDWSSEYGSITPIIGLQQARFTPGILSQTEIWACAGSVNESIKINVVQGNIENLIIHSSQENFTSDETATIILQGEDIRNNIFSLSPSKENWTYPEHSHLSISNEITWSPKKTGWYNVSVHESGIFAELSFNISHGVPIRLSIIGDEMLITSDEVVQMQSMLVDADDNHWPVFSNWSTTNTESSTWLTSSGDKATFEGWTAGSWKILSEYTHPVSGQYFAAEYDVLVTVGELSQILLDGHGLTFTVDEVLDLNPRAIDSAGNLIHNLEMTWTINGKISTGSLEEMEYRFSTQIIGIYEIQVISEGGSASITFDFIYGEAIRIVVTETSSNQLSVKSGESIELLTEGEDQYGNRFALNVNWNLTNGTGEMEPSSRGIGYYDFKPGDASGFVIMEYSGLDLFEQIVIEVKPGDIKKLRIEYEGELKQGNTVRLLISAVDDSENIVSFCDSNSAIVTTDVGKIIRESNQLYLKFEGSGSTTVDVGCFGFKETFYIQVEDTMFWGIFEDSQKLIIYSSLFLMIVITILLILMIQRSRIEYEDEDFEELPPLPMMPRIFPNLNNTNSTIPPLPIMQMPPLPSLPNPQVQLPIQQPVVPLPQAQLPIQQPVVPLPQAQLPIQQPPVVNPQLISPEIQKEDGLLDSIDLLVAEKTIVKPSPVIDLESKNIDDYDDLSWD